MRADATAEKATKGRGQADRQASEERHDRDQAGGLAAMGEVAPGGAPGGNPRTRTAQQRRTPRQRRQAAGRTSESRRKGGNRGRCYPIILANEIGRSVAAPHRRSSRKRSMRSVSPRFAA